MQLIKKEGEKKELHNAPRKEEAIQIPWPASQMPP